MNVQSSSPCSIPMTKRSWQRLLIWHSLLWLSNPATITHLATQILFFQLYFMGGGWTTLYKKNSMVALSFLSRGFLDTEQSPVKMSALRSLLVNRSMFFFFSVPCL